MRIPLGIYVLLCLALCGVGIAEIVHVETGTPATATVTDCRREIGLRGGYDVCTGSWMVNGHVFVGEINGATTDDLRKSISIRVSGGTAYVRSLVTPIVLTSVGVLLLTLIPAVLALGRRRGAAPNALGQSRGRAALLTRVVATLPGLTSVEQLRAVLKAPARAGVSVSEIVSYPPTPGLRLTFAPPADATQITPLLGIRHPTPYPVDAHRQSWCVGELRRAWRDDYGNDRVAVDPAQIGSWRVTTRLAGVADSALVSQIEIVLAQPD